MKKVWLKRIVTTITAGALVIALALSSMEGGSTKTFASGSANKAIAAKTDAPKYVFMFIGDGMSYPQVQIASDYLGALAQPKNSKILEGNKDLSFMKFPVAGSAITYDSTSFCPDSASTATSLATGNKTYSGTLNMDETGTVKYETIAEKLKDQLGYKIGVISTVNLNHATPAAYYAHQVSRNNYYEIGQELIKSDFDYFAGGALLQPEGKNKDKTSIYTLAEKAGYKVINKQADAKKLNKKDKKAIVIGEKLADSDSLSYSNDATSNEWKLKDYVSKGIEVLDNKKGFFMMVEGGKIDWASHANDAGSTISDTVALSDAVKEAVKFYNKHPKETLILVTGDHETGGLTIGYAGTNYDTYLTNLKNQKISYSKFDSEYVTKYKTNKTSFEDVLKDIKKNFGLITENDKDATKDSKLVLTAYELEKLKAAYHKSLSNDSKSRTDEEYILYGSYEPLTVTITHLLNNKSGISFSSYSHTGLPVGVFAQGIGADLFAGYYDNTEIYDNLAYLLKVK